MRYAVQEAIAAMRRAPLLVGISILSIGLSLFIIGLFGLTAYNVRAALQELEERVEIVAYLRDGVTEEEIRATEGQIRSFPEVLELRYISREEALVIAHRDHPDFAELFAGADGNPLPASFEIELRPGFRTPQATGALASQLELDPLIDEVLWGSEWVAKIYSLQRIAAGATAGVGGAFALVAGIIIATAIRIAIFARREEIELMRLVGATNAFIRRPFLIEGVVVGVAGGGLAVLLTYLGHRFVSLSLMELEWLPTPWVVGALLCGTSWGVLASTIALRRHLREG